MSTTTRRSATTGPAALFVLGILLVAAKLHPVLPTLRAGLGLGATLAVI